MGLQGYTVVLCFNVYFIYYLFLAVLDLGCCTRLSLAVVRRLYTLVVVLGLLTAEMGSRAFGHQELRLPGSTAQVQYLWGMSLAALQHVGSSQTRNQTCVSCTGR